MIQRCTKCHEEPRRHGQRWCRKCHAAYEKQRKAKQMKRLRSLERFRARYEIGR